MASITRWHLRPSSKVAAPGTLDSPVLSASSVAQARWWKDATRYCLQCREPCAGSSTDKSSKAASYPLARSSFSSPSRDSVPCSLLWSYAVPATCGVDSRKDHGAELHLRLMCDRARCEPEMRSSRRSQLAFSPVVSTTREGNHRFDNTPGSCNLTEQPAKLVDGM